MSDEREKKWGKAASDEVKPDDVEAHVKKRDAADDAPKDDGDDDVEAHVKLHKST